MQSLLLGLAVLACPVGMGVMMWMMNRGQKTGPQADAKTDAKTDAGEGNGQQQLTALRAEIDQLKAEHNERSTDGGRR